MTTTFDNILWVQNINLWIVRIHRLSCLCMVIIVLSAWIGSHFCFKNLWSLFWNQYTESRVSIITFSSPAAILKESSMTEPTAMRTADDECISFHTVSLSTCVGKYSVLYGRNTDIWTEVRQTGMAERLPHPYSSTRKHSIHLLADWTWNSQWEKCLVWTMTSRTTGLSLNSGFKTFMTSMCI